MTCQRIDLLLEFANEAEEYENVPHQQGSDHLAIIIALRISVGISEQ